MKQKKVKEELVLATYKDYVRHYGVQLGAKKWKESKKQATDVGKFLETGARYAHKILTEEKKHKKKMDEIEAKIKGERLFEAPQVEDLEPLQKAILGGAERQDIRKTKADIFECGASMIELIGMSAWNKWIKPQIQKDAVDFVRKTLMLSGEESHKATGGYNYARKILKTIDKWVQDYTYLMREEEAKQNKGVK